MNKSYCYSLVLLTKREKEIEQLLLVPNQGAMIKREMQPHRETNCIQHVVGL